MSNIVLGYNNVADSATYDVGGVWNSINNLKDKRLAVYAQSFNALLQTTQFRFDLGSVYPVTVLDIANHNLTEAAYWRARFGLAPFDADISNGTLDSRITATSSANGTVFNENGVLVAAGTTGRLDFDRLTPINGFLRSEDLTQPAWSKTNGVVALDSKTIAWNPIGNQQLNNTTAMDFAVDSYTISGWCRLVSGDGSFGAFIFNGSATINSSQTVATSKWTKFSFTILNTTANFNAAGSAGLFRTSTSEAVIQFKYLQLQRGTGGFPYRSTGDSRVFACIGLLREQASTNLILQSAALDNASWTKSATVVTANQAIGLFGTATMDFMKEDSTTAFHQASSSSVTFSTNTNYLASCFVKASSGSRSIQIILSLSANGFALGSFTLSSGTFSAGTVSVGGTNPWSNARQWCIPMGGGIYWLAVAAQSGATAGAGNAIYRLDNNSGLAYAGDNTSGHYFEGMDVQQTSSLRSHIPSTTTTVTRTADSVSVTGTNFSSWFTNVAGTLYSEFSPRSDSNLNIPNTLVTLSDGTANNQIGLRTRTSDDAFIGGIIQGGGAEVAVVISSPTVIYGGTISRGAMAYNTNSMKASFNGTLSSLGSSVTIPTNLTQMNIGAWGDNTSNTEDGWIRRVTWWPMRMDDSQLTNLTMIGPDAIDFDTGWLPALQFGFAGDVPSDWGKRGYNLMALVRSTVAARYGTIEIIDPNNADPNHITLGRLFLCNGLQTGINADFSNYADSRNDLSSVRDAEAGNKFSSVRRRKKQTTMTFSMLSQDEANTAHEVQDAVGITDEVIFIPDPADAAMTQRYGGLGYLSKLDSVLYRFINLRSMSFSWEEKI